MKIKPSKQTDNRTETLRWQGKIWLEGKQGTFMGYGRVVLLERIRDHGSISLAAKSMKMSYKHAWDLLDSMNSQVDTSLVKTKRGGKNGGGASLTPAGEQAIALFWEFSNRLHEILQEMTDCLSALKFPQDPQDPQDPQE